MKIRSTMPHTVWVLGIASLLTDVSSEMIHAVLPLFLVSTLGAGTAMVGVIEGLGEATASIIKLASGAFSDYLKSRKPLIVGGYGLSTSVKVLFALAPNAMVVLVARCLDRVGKGIRGAPRDALVADVTPADMRGAAYGLRQSLDSVGAFLGPLFAFVLLSMQAGYRSVFWSALIPGAMAVLLLALVIKEPSQHVQTAGRVNPISRAAIRRFGSRFWYVFAVVLVFSLGNSSDAFLLLKLKQVGLAVEQVPLGLVVMNIMYALSAYPAGKMSDKIGRRRMLLLSFALYAAVYAALSFATSAWQVWLLLAVYGCYLGLSQAVLLAVVADTVPADLRGTAFGFLNLSIGIALLPASLLAGWLWQTISPAAAFQAGAAFAAIATIMFGCSDIANKKPEA